MKTKKRIIWANVLISLVLVKTSVDQWKRVLVEVEGVESAAFCLFAMIHEKRLHHRCHWGPKKFHWILKKILILPPDIHEWKGRWAVPVHEIDFWCWVLWNRLQCFKCLELYIVRVVSYRVVNLLDFIGLCICKNPFFSCLLLCGFTLSLGKGNFLLLFSLKAF